MTELLKARCSRGLDPDLFFWRDNLGAEIDILFEEGQKLKAIEVKSGKTFAPEHAAGLETWMRYSGAKAEDCSVVYAGERALQWKGLSLVPWRQVASAIEHGLS